MSSGKEARMMMRQTGGTSTALLPPREWCRQARHPELRFPVPLNKKHQQLELVKRRVGLEKQEALRQEHAGRERKPCLAVPACTQRRSLKVSRRLRDAEARLS